MVRLFPFMFVGLILCNASVGQQSVRRDGVAVRYSGVSQPFAEAIARTVASARQQAIDTFRFEMPDTIDVEIMADPSGKVRLFNDGQDRFSLTVRTENDLAQPRSSGVFHLYGLCHEVGHLAMYRPIRDHSWLSYDAAEGWAHYVGSRLVDGVYKQEGAELWPDQYDYRSDGMQRLQSQLAADDASPVAKSAGLWQEMTELAGDDAVAAIFAAWGKAQIDPDEPGNALKAVLKESPQGPQLVAWWERAEESFIVKRPKSGFTAETLSPNRLDGEPRELAHDDGQQAGKKSSAGGGHAVRFESGPGAAAYLTSVRIYGSRYGLPAAPKEDFRVWLCDEEFQPIAEFAYPYARFKRGTPKWVTLKTKPTKVPPNFIVGVSFNPTGTKGVFAGHDQAGTGHSLSGLPGGPLRLFDKGDWMIRVTLERAKHDIAVAGDKSDVISADTRRTWRDATGEFTLVAELVEVQDGRVRLKKADGQILSIPLEKLSAADQEFLRTKKR